MGAGLTDEEAMLIETVRAFIDKQVNRPSARWSTPTPIRKHGSSR